MFIYTGLCPIPQSNIFSNFTFNISNMIFDLMFSSIGFYLVIFLGVLNIVNKLQEIAKLIN